MNRRDALFLASAPMLSLPVGLVVPLLLPGPALADSTAPGDEAAAARLRRGGVVLLMRHAATDPGVGDPPGFALGNCASQRNLSAEGRAQAQRIGAWLAARGLKPAKVRSSAWCRCVDTAQLGFGRAEVWPALNSFFDDGSTKAAQTVALAAALPGVSAEGFEVWVTHQVNMTAWLGGFASMGEGWVVEPARSGAAAPRWVERLRLGA